MEKKKDLHLKLSAQMHDYYEENKEKLKHEPRETEEVKKFIERGDVKKMFDKYDKEL